jgi:hypothetical protein
MSHLTNRTTSSGTTASRQAGWPAEKRAAVGWALDPEPAVEHSEPVGEPQHAAPLTPGPSHAVVAHVD